MKKLLIYGSKEFAEIVRNLSGVCGYTFCGYIDDFHSNAQDVVGDFEHVRREFDPKEYKIAIAIGYDHIKQRNAICRKVKNASYSIPSLIHPTAYVDPSATFGDGLIAMVNCTIDYNVCLGDNVVIWPGAVINHDSVVEDNIFISPNTTICGFCRVGENSFLGATATIVDHNIVPPHTFVKAGAVYSSGKINNTE